MHLKTTWIESSLRRWNQIQLKSSRHFAGCSFWLEMFLFWLHMFPKCDISEDIVQFVIDFIYLREYMHSSLSKSKEKEILKRDWESYRQDPTNKLHSTFPVVRIWIKLNRRESIDSSLILFLIPLTMRLWWIKKKKEKREIERRWTYHHCLQDRGNWYASIHELWNYLLHFQIERGPP